ncbi:MAG: hypothetical protein GWN73_33605, partial [Actinobacteria bacterium]|nr:hypothetical protein [Actinomycetota bacterium]
MTGPREAIAVEDGYLEGLAQGRYEVVATLVVGAGAAPLTVSVPVVVTWPAVERLEIEPARGSLY